MEGIITAVIIIISIIGWVSNAINENKQKAQQGGKQRPQKKRKLQSELESFLKELQGEKPQQQQKPQPQRQQKQPQRSPEKRRRTQTVKNSEARSLSDQQQRSSQSQKNPPSTTDRPKHQSVFHDEATHHVGSKNLGQGLSKHVEEYIQSRHPGGLKSNLAEDLSSKETSTLDWSGTQRGPRVAGSPASRQAIELLQTIDSIRTAIVLNEILQPPVSQRLTRF